MNGQVLPLTPNNGDAKLPFKKMNVLIYNGPGTSQASIRGCLASLEALLKPFYSPRFVDAATLCKEPWAQNTALLVMPGGRDLAYCQTLDGAGNRAIQEFLRRGGRYLGFCAGGYYGSRKVEFELGTTIAVEGRRELKLFEGTCKGCAFPGFVYDSEAGAKCVDLEITSALTTKKTVLGCYWNGGGVFVDAVKVPGCTVLASYRSSTCVEQQQAAVIKTKVGNGIAILTGVHPEIGYDLLESISKKESAERAVEGYETLQRMKEMEEDRLEFLKQLLLSLELKVNDTPMKRPALSTLHLVSSRSEDSRHVAHLLMEMGSSGVVECENDVFQILRHPSDRPLDAEGLEGDYDAQKKYISIESRYFERGPTREIDQSSSVLLLKTKSTPQDPYELAFQEKHIAPYFVPVLEHAMVNADKLLSYLQVIQSLFSGLIVTSQRSVEAIGLALKSLTEEQRQRLLQMEVFTVGPATCQALRNLGFVHVLGSESGNGDVLATFILDRRDRSLDLPLFFIVGDKRRDIITKRLHSAQVGLEELVVYETVTATSFPADFEDAVKQAVKVDWIVFFSPAGADVALAYIKEKSLQTKIATIGPTTQAYLENEWNIVPALVSSKPDANTLSRELVNCRGPGTSLDALSTPLFNLKNYFAHLEVYRAGKKNMSFGSTMLYAENVSSSQTLLDKNFKLQQRLPQGFTVLASHQLAGRGRGSNSWISPPGVLSFSTILRHVPAVASGSSIVFIQYLISLACVRSINAMRSEMKVFIKWPNDIYALLPLKDKDSSDRSQSSAVLDLNGCRYAKVSGSLISTTYWEGEYIMTIGVGINVSNPQPTVSLNSLLNSSSANIELEDLLASIMTTFETMYVQFAKSGFGVFEQEYYKAWLHTDQQVILEQKEGKKAWIRGIDLQYGTLKVEEVGSRKVWDMQADGNSFDMMKGLLKIKK